LTIKPAQTLTLLPRSSFSEQFLAKHLLILAKTAKKTKKQRFCHTTIANSGILHQNRNAGHVYESRIKFSNPRKQQETFIKYNFHARNELNVNS
jgi:hypothetical protein